MPHPSPPKPRGKPRGYKGRGTDGLLGYAERAAKAVKPETKRRGGTVATPQQAAALPSRDKKAGGEQELEAGAKRLRNKSGRHCSLPEASLGATSGGIVGGNVSGVTRRKVSR